MRPSGEQNAAQQRFLSLFLRSEQEIFRYVAALVPNVADTEDIVQETALEPREIHTLSAEGRPDAEIVASRGPAVQHSFNFPIRNKTIP